MKKALLILMLISSFISFSLELKADVITDRVNLIKKLSNDQDLIANIIELYIELYGTNPNSLDTLKDVGLLDNSFNFSYSSNFSISTNTITINSNFPTAEIYQRDFYLNNFARGRVIEPVVNGNTFTTKYFLSKEASNTKSYVGIVSNISPTTPSSTSGSWYNTRLKKIFFYNSGWQSLDAKKLWIVKSVAELNSISAAENDAGIVLTTTSLEKYLYVSNSWVKIQNIPFNYNTGF